MGLCQPSKNYTVNLKTYSGGGSISKTIAECVNLIKGVNSSYDFIFLDPYNYPYIIGGYTLPANTTDLYFITDAKYTSYTNIIGVRGESNGSSVNVLNTQMSMYCIYNDGTRLIGAGVGHNFSSTTLDGNTYRTASGSYEYPYIFYCDRDDVNIYINNTLQLNWENANTALYKLGTKTYGLQDEWLSKLNEENPFSGITITHSNLFTYMVDTGDIIDIDWSKGIQTIEMKYGKIVMGSDGYGRVHVYDNNGGIIVQITGILTWLTTRNLYFIACVNHEHQVGRIGLIVDPGSYGTSLYISSPSKNREAYEFITQNKLGATVKVSYYLPDDTYTYSKLTYNSEHEPEDKDDGTSIDILPSNTSVNVEGLEEDTLYYFTIFTNKSESEPFPFVVGDMDHYPVPTEFKTEYDNIFIMPLSDISNPPGGGSWDYGYQQFIDTYLPHYTDYSYSGLNSSPYMLDVASATTNTSSDIRMSSTKIDMLITPDNKIKFRNYVSDVSLNGYSKLQYRYLANYDCKMVGPYSYDSSDVWGDKSFNSDVDLWTYVSRNIRFVNVYYGINWDNALIMR